MYFVPEVDFQSQTSIVPGGSTVSSTSLAPRFVPRSWMRSM